MSARGGGSPLDTRTARRPVCLPRIARSSRTERPTRERRAHDPRTPPVPASADPAWRWRWRCGPSCGRSGTQSSGFGDGRVRACLDGPRDGLFTQHLSWEEVGDDGRSADAARDSRPCSLARLDMDRELCRNSARRFARGGRTSVVSLVGCDRRWPQLGRGAPSEELSSIGFGRPGARTESTTGAPNLPPSSPPPTPFAATPCPRRPEISTNTHSATLGTPCTPPPPPRGLKFEPSTTHHARGPRRSSSKSRLWQLRHQTRSPRLVAPRAHTRGAAEYGIFFIKKKVLAHATPRGRAALPEAPQLGFFSRS
ncbi:hypothetical protein BC628DRAFT_1122832 [Trametes gibbosa]|nr:hypothetical protein BC628DRAFT_1122832 [Trametes gibbosa]